MPQIPLCQDNTDEDYCKVNSDSSSFDKTDKATVLLSQDLKNVKTCVYISKYHMLINVRKQTLLLTICYIGENITY